MVHIFDFEQFCFEIIAVSGCQLSGVGVVQLHLCSICEQLCIRC